MRVDPDFTIGNHIETQSLVAVEPMSPYSAETMNACHPSLHVKHTCMPDLRYLIYPNIWKEMRT